MPNRNKEPYYLRHQQEDKHLNSKIKAKVSKKVTKKPAAPSSSKTQPAPSSKPRTASNSMAAPEQRAVNVSASSIDLSGGSEFLAADADAASDRILDSISEMKKEMKNMFANNAQQVKCVDDKLDSVIRDINAIKVDLSATKQTVAALEESVNFTDTKIDKIEKSVIPALKAKVNKQEEEFEEKLVQMEIHQRKQNLLVYGVPDKDKEDIYATTREILCYFLKVTPDDAARIPLVNAHRLPRPSQRGEQLAAGQQDTGPSPVIIRFASMFHRDRVLHAYEFQSKSPRRQQSNPPGPGVQHHDGQTWDPIFARVSIRSDLPAKLKRERGKLASIAYRLRREEKVSTIAYRLRREEKVSTRIKVIGSKVLLQTRKTGRDGAPNTPWTTWTE